MATFMLRIQFEGEKNGKCATTLQMINFSLPTNGDRALSDQDDAPLMKAATWLHSAIIPLSDLSEGANEDASELDTNVDEPGSIDELYHYITEKEKQTGPRFIWSYATGSEKYGGDKSLKNPWEKASIIAPYVASDLITRCFRPKVICMSIKVLTRIWDHGSESDAGATFTTARIFWSWNYGTKAMGQEVRDAIETGRDLGSHALNSLRADRTDYFAGSLYVFAKVTVLLEDSGILEIDATMHPKEKNDGKLYSARDGHVQDSTILNAQMIGAGVADKYCKRFLIHNPNQVYQSERDMNIPAIPSTTKQAKDSMDKALARATSLNEDLLSQRPGLGTEA